MLTNSDALENLFQFPFENVTLISCATLQSQTNQQILVRRIGVKIG